MSLNVEYRKGRPCETENCRSRLFYEDNGVLWCKNGHQQPGVEVEAYERIPTGGRKSKKKVEALERESRIYEGTKAIHLYIQSHQLILRKQVHALIHTHGFPAQLETVVHDLWALKLQLLGKKLNASGAILGNAETTDGEDGERLFSSQAESESGNGSGREKGGVGIDKDMPVLIETLGLCYLGAVLLRIPVLVASLVR
ncbi:MAG: Pol I core factor CF [Icmadophila ericetorum]|nr:Pol I core factor CF [Icmadophila ericetorum]